MFFVFLREKPVVCLFKITDGDTVEYIVPGTTYLVMAALRHRGYRSGDSRFYMGRAWFRSRSSCLRVIYIRIQLTSSR